MDGRSAFGAMLRTMTAYHSIDRGLGTPFVDAFRFLWMVNDRYAPKTLYKYCKGDKLDRTLGDLAKGRLYLSNPARFNDARDVLPTYDSEAIEQRMSVAVNEYNMTSTFDFYRQFYGDKIDLAIDYYRKWVKRAGGFDRWKVQRINESISGLRNSLIQFREHPRCACLSQSNSNGMMWGQYAQNGEGFVIEYETPNRDASCLCANCCENCGAVPFMLVPIQYAGRVDFSVFSDVLTGSQAPIPYLTEHYYLALLNAVAYKERVWEHEEEWRIVTHACPKAKDSQMYVKVKPTALYLGKGVKQESFEALYDAACRLNLSVFIEEETFTVDSSGVAFQRIR